MLSSFRNNPRSLACFAAILLSPASVFAAGLSFAPASLDFGSNALGESRTKAVTLRNTTANDIVLGETSIQENPGGYTLVSTTCGASLPAGHTCRYHLRYTAKSLQPARAFLALTTLDPAFPLVKVALSANPYPALNDTGVTHCGNATENYRPCPVPGYPRQDAENGRDRTRNNDKNGHAGFNFTKISRRGKPLPASATQWDCVRDNVTGLIWEVKPIGDRIAGNQGLHDADDLYTWYSTDDDNNAGSSGSPDSANGCFGHKDGQPETYCNTEAYVKRVNAEGWCNAKVWRLPTRMELRGLADQSVGGYGIAIDLNYFPDTFVPDGNWTYWTASPGAYYADSAWAVGFRSGSAGLTSRGSQWAVRLVQGGQ